jgi:hypothetical protein
MCFLHTHMKILTDDVLQAYDELGGIDYLLSQPKLLERILIRLIKQSAPPSELIVDLSQEMPWLDFANRLSYKSFPIVSGVDDIEHRALSSAPDSWKPSTISPQEEFDRLPPLPPKTTPDIVIK